MGKDTGKEMLPYNRPVTDEAIFKVSKEIIVKFIEVGRLTPADFEKQFHKVYSTVRETVRSQENE